MANRRFIDFPIASTSSDTDIILIWQDGLNKQTTKATLLSGLPEDLADLNDVVISGLTNGQILRYNSTTGVWENTDQGNLDLNDLNDVTIVSPSNGQVLVYNSSTSQWENSSGGYVPYVGAVTTVDLGAQGLRAGYVRFDTTVASVPDEQGLMYWDGSRSTVALIMNGTLQHIGQDSFFYVKNSTGSSINKGVAVRFDGTDGASGHLKIAPFLADGTYPSTYFMGVTADTIGNGEFGQVMHFGELEGINTSGFTAGDLLYASTTVAGGFQTTAPVAPNNIVLIAAAVNSKNNGAIIVRPTYGSNINNDEGVKITTPTTGQLLQLQAGGLWENKTLGQVLGGTSSQFVKGDGSLDSTSYQPLLTNPVTGTGTTNYLPKFTGASTIGNSNLINDASGNLGLGVIPSAWLSVYRAFQIGVGGGISGRTDSGLEMQLLGNAYRNTSGNYIYSTTDKAARFVLDGDASFGWYTAPSGTAGNAITFTQAMTLTSGNNLLVGTGSDNGARLQVSGAATVSGQITGPSGAVTESKFNFIGYNNAYGGISANTGFNTSYNSVSIYSNFNSARSGQGNASNPSWILDLGGSFPDQDSFSIFRSPSGSFSFSNLFKLASTGAATFSSSVTAANLVLANSDTLTWGGAYGPNIPTLVGVSGASGYFAIYPAGSTGGEKFRITNSGNVLIGSPPAADNGARLQVSGTGKVFTWSGATTGTQYFDAANSGANLVWGMEGSAGGILYSGASPYSAVFGNENNYPVQFGTNATIRMTITSAGDLMLKGRSTTTNYEAVFYNDNSQLAINANNTSVGKTINFNVRNDQNAMTITSSGNVLIGTISQLQSTERLAVTSSSNAAILAQYTGGATTGWAAKFWNNATSGDNLFIEFLTETSITARGSVTYNRGSGVTAYNTTSDYRIKTDISNFNSLNIISNLKPQQFRIGNATRKTIGFIAHELQEFFPQAVTGIKDQIDNFGNPIYQSVDYSQLTGLLVKAIQELKQEIDTLKN
jgi:hypothetical protein